MWQKLGAWEESLVSKPDSSFMIVQIGAKWHQGFLKFLIPQLTSDENLAESPRAWGYTVYVHIDMYNKVYVMIAVPMDTLQLFFSAHDQVPFSYVQREKRSAILCIRLHVWK